VADLETQIRSHAESLARQFDRVLQVLEAWGYLEGWQLTDRGDRLVRIFHECDLLVAEALELGLFEDLAPEAVAGLASCFTYEHRSSTPPPEPWFPNTDLRERYEAITRLAADLNADESRLGLAQTRPPDAGFVGAAHGWCVGEGFDDVLGDEELTGGDFVRNMRQLLDLLRQIGDAAPNSGTKRAARAAADSLFRGVVAASSAISTTDNTGEGVDDDVREPAP
jgi:ATP-dependent RNA helicase HelY